MKLSFSILLLLCISFFSKAQKNYAITKIETAPSIDGKPDDNVWNTCTEMSNFIQTQPIPLAASKYKTVIKMCYNNNSIFILAEMYQPKATIFKQLCERDNLNNVNADNFSIFFDTYNDKQNGFAYKISSAGVQQDEKLIAGGSPSGDNSDKSDVSWDAVWFSSVKIYEDRWVAEIEIPFSATRLSTALEQTWGINFRRYMRKDNESSFWSTFDINKSGFLAQEGTLIGLQNIKAPKRLVFYPYFSTGYSSVPNANGTRTSDFLRSGGVDLKAGLNDAFTLDMSLIPDFSQVISDNLIRNLGAFEQQLSENRPFFTEGTELFNKQGMLYSRRIGASPQGYYNVADKYSDATKYKIIKNPNVSNLYNAFKISGRTKNSMGVGFFNAIQAPMNASIQDIATGNIITEKTGNLTNYNMIVLDKVLPHQSYINFTNASTLRTNGDRLADVVGLQTTIFNKEENYSFNATYNLSYVLEDKKTKLGQFISAGVQKNAGKFKWGIVNNFFSPSFDQTDMGIQFNYNHIENTVYFGWNNNTPKNKNLRIHNWNTRHTLNQNYQPYAIKSYNFEASTFFLHKSFWDVTFYIGGEPFAKKDFYQLAKFNLPINYYGYSYFGFNGSTDSRKKLFFYTDVSHSIAFGVDYKYNDASAGCRYLFNNHFQMGTKIQGTWNRADVGRTSQYDVLTEPIVAYRHVTEYTWDINARYNFNPYMSINGRFRHYTSFINYKQFYKVDASGNYINNPYPAIAGLNENYNLQNVDVFFNWILKRGSRVIVSYKQWLNDGYIINDNFEGQRFGDNIRQIGQSPKAFSLSARIIWYLDYNRIKLK
jgi:Domain of unknown function (DUF5916)/Carbohydrate family 9 binding domain-like